VQCPWCGVETRRTFARCIECGRNLERKDPPLWVVPAGTEPFAETADCSLRRRRHDGALWYAGFDGLLAAEVVHGGDGSYRCVALDGTVLFAARPYGPGGPESVVVTDPGDGDRPLGAHVVDRAVPPVISVRDETSAPVGRLTGGDSSLVLTETGGGVVATVERRRVDLPDGWVDDEWVLDATRDLPTLDRRALVAVLLVCRALLSLPAYQRP
jgi:hypothetical protein